MEEQNKNNQTASAVGLETVVRHSFTDTNGKRFVACSECERGGNGSDKDKCAAGWRKIKYDHRGWFCGAEIKGEIIKKKISKSKQRYLRYLEYGDMFNSFLDFCHWDAQPERSWNT